MNKTCMLLLFNPGFCINPVKGCYMCKNICKEGWIRKPRLAKNQLCCKYKADINKRDKFDGALFLAPPCALFMGTIFQQFSASYISK